MEDRKSLKETIQIAKTQREFKSGIVLALIGLVVISAGMLFAAENAKILIGLIGMFTGYSGFDQISKVIAGIQNPK